MNNIDSFSILPDDLKLTIFPDIPRELAIVLPYVSKIFLALANNNDLWDKIATKYNVKNLELDFPYNKSEAKFSYLMRNKEIAYMFIDKKYNISDMDFNINIYNPTSDLEKLNQYINMGQTVFSKVFNYTGSPIKPIKFMLDICQNPRIDGYIRPFMNDKEVICVVMNRCKEILEKEYKIQKNFIQQIENHRKQKNIPAPLVMNPLEETAREIIWLYEGALQIYNSRNNI